MAEPLLDRLQALLEADDDLNCIEGEINDATKRKSEKQCAEELARTNAIKKRTRTHVLSFDLPARALSKNFLLSLNSTATFEAHLARQFKDDRESASVGMPSQCAQCQRWVMVLDHENHCKPCQAVGERLKNLEYTHNGPPPLCFCPDAQTHYSPASECMGSFAEKAGPKKKLRLAHAAAEEPNALQQVANRQNGLGRKSTMALQGEGVEEAKDDDKGPVALAKPDRCVQCYRQTTLLGAGNLCGPCLAVGDRLKNLDVTRIEELPPCLCPNKQVHYHKDTECIGYFNAGQKRRQRIQREKRAADREGKAFEQARNQENVPIAGVAAGNSFFREKKIENIKQKGQPAWQAKASWRNDRPS